MLVPFCVLLLAPSLASAFDKRFCEFHSPSYSLEWAYAPSSKTVVFVLKSNSTLPRYWTGVGFEGKKGAVDFVGVLVRDQHIVLADAYLNETGVLYTDMLGNIQTIGYDYDGEHLVAKFARPLLSDDIKHDQQLDECLTFLMPTTPGAISSSGIKPDLNLFNRIQVCDIEAHCSVNVNRQGAVLNKTKNNEEIRFAKSVDVSGTGDPCSFAGHDYTANWTYDKESDRVSFLYRFPAKKGKQWTALGLGDNMSDMDIVLLFLEDGQVKKIGDYFSSGYRPPTEDADQDWKLEASKLVDSEVEVRFSRRVVTEDTEKDRPMDECVLFQFGVNGGKYADNFRILKHEGWPDLYKACNLRTNCEAVKLEKRGKKKQNKGRKGDQSTTPDVEESNDHTTAEHNEQSPTEASIVKAAVEDNVEGSGQEGSGQEEDAAPATPQALTTTSAPTTDAQTESSTVDQVVSDTTLASTTVTSTEQHTTTAAETTADNQCDAQKPDLVVCDGYMHNYLEQVKDWAQRHNEPMDKQYGKACTLLSAVPHVPTLCCHIFHKVCAGQISD